MELEYYNSSNQPVKIKKRIRLQKQVAIACLGAYMFLVFNFLIGIFSEPIDAKVLGTQRHYLGKRSMNTSSDITIYTDKGDFRCTQKSPEEIMQFPNLKLWQTPFYSTTLRYQLQNAEEDIYWSVVNIYVVFSFFPILGLIGAILCLVAKNYMAERYGFQLSIFSAIMLVFSCLMMGMI